MIREKLKERMKKKNP